MREHNKKIYYSAGVISIILLPMFSILYLNEIDAFKQYTSINLGIWNGKEEVDKGTKGINSFLNSKKIETITFLGNANSDNEKLKFSRGKVRKLISEQDSINAIKFHFNNKSQYGTYVEVLNILIEEKAKFYVPYKNDIWFTNPKPKKINKNEKHFKLFKCGYHFINLEEEKKSIKCDKIKELLKKYYLSIGIYFLMLFLVVKKML